MVIENRQPPWTTFSCGGIIYDLSHLRTFTTKFTRPSQKDKPAESYSVNISFSHHCFTRGLPAEGEAYEAMLRFDVDGDERLFDMRRWRLSRKLPNIIERLSEHKCFQTKHSNYFIISGIDDNGTAVEYEVFFRVWKPGKGRINLHVESAYVRETDFKTSKPKGMPIGLFVILSNTLNNRPIHFR